MHHPGKAVCDLAVMLASGVQCPADVRMLWTARICSGRSDRIRRSANRAQTAVFGGFRRVLAHLRAAIDTLGAPAWIPAVDADGTIRDGAWVAEIPDLLDLHGWPPGMRVIARKERPHPGAQLTLTDVDGLRVTYMATNDTSPDLPALEARHRQRTRLLPT